jgi:hypothetical protein
LPCKNSYQFQTLEDIKNALRMITTTTNVAQLAGLLAALVIYIVRHKELNDNLVLRMAVMLLRTDEEERGGRGEERSTNRKYCENIGENVSETWFRYSRW